VCDILLIVLRLIDDGIEIATLWERGRVRLRAVNRPWGDDVLDFRLELTDEGVSAATCVRTIAGDGIALWTAELAESYRGWDGVRRWESLERDARIDATHDGPGHVTLRFVIRGPRGFEPVPCQNCSHGV
jgi:Family of unknown function (DUF6228)